jgi:phage portal protein BeeE
MITAMSKKRNKGNRIALEATPEKRDVILGGFPWGTTNGGTIYPAAFPLSVTEAAGISAVRRCVSLIANAIAGRQWQEWEGTRKLSPSRIVRRPAASMSRREWTWRVIASMALDDLSYLRMVGGVDDDGVPGSLLPIPTGALSPRGLVDPFGILPPTQYVMYGTNGLISAEEIIQVRSAFWPGVPAHLVGILRMARSTMMASWAADSYNARYWQSGGQPVTQISTEQELVDGQAEDIAARWQTRRSMGPDYPAVFGKGAKAEPYGADVSGATGVDARRQMVLDIGNLFGVAARYLNVALQGQSLEYSTVHDEALSLERHTLSAFIDPIQDVISELLPGDYIEGRHMVIDMTPFTRAGQYSRYQAWQIATGNKPWMDPEEIRAAEGLAPGAPVPEADPLPENSADAEKDEVPASA